MLLLGRRRHGAVVRLQRLPQQPSKHVGLAQYASGGSDHIEVAGCARQCCAVAGYPDVVVIGAAGRDNMRP